MDKTTTPAGMIASRLNISTTVSNNSINGQPPSFVKMPWGGMSGEPKPPNIPMSIFLVLCICVSTFGNGAVLYIAALKAKKSSLQRLNLLISSLALSDFLQAFSLMMPQLLKNIFGEWDSGILMCKIHSCLRSMQTNISISTLTLITLERFLYLDKLSNGTENVSLYIGMNVALWCVHICLAIPLGIWNTVLYTPRMCTIPIKTISMTSEYVVVVKTAFFFVPLVIMWISNIGIIYKTRKSSLSVRPLQTNVPPSNNNATNSRMDRQKRTILTCLMLAVVFTVTHLPFETCLFVLKSATNAKQITRVTTLMSYFWPMTILNACINPFIYSVFFKEFRRRMKEMMRCRRCPETCNILCFKGTTPKNILPMSSNRTDQTTLPEIPNTSDYGTNHKFRNGNNNQVPMILSPSNCDINLPFRLTDQTTFATGLRPGQVYT